jgi:hypothetical protein
VANYTLSENSDELVAEWIGRCPERQDVECLLEYLPPLCDWPTQSAIDSRVQPGGQVHYYTRVSNTDTWITYLIVEDPAEPFLEFLRIWSLP